MTHQLDESSTEPMEKGESTPEKPSAEVDLEESADEYQPLLAHLTQRQPLPPGDVCRILAANRGPTGARGSGTPRPQAHRQVVPPLRI